MPRYAFWNTINRSCRASVFCLELRDWCSEKSVYCASQFQFETCWNFKIKITIDLQRVSEADLVFVIDHSHMSVNTKWLLDYEAAHTVSRIVRLAGCLAQLQTGDFESCVLTISSQLISDLLLWFSTLELEFCNYKTWWRVMSSSSSDQLEHLCFRRQSHSLLSQELQRQWYQPWMKHLASKE